MELEYDLLMLLRAADGGLLVATDDDDAQLSGMYSNVPLLQPAVGSTTCW
jgi:hypothetical protein